MVDTERDYANASKEELKATIKQIEEEIHELRTEVEWLEKTIKQTKNKIKKPREEINQLKTMKRRLRHLMQLSSDNKAMKRR